MTPDVPPFRVLASVSRAQFTFWIDDVPVHAVGATLDEAQAGFVDALVNCADAWQRELHQAPNHRQNRALVEMIAREAGDPEALRRLIFDDRDPEHGLEP